MLYLEVKRYAFGGNYMNIEMLSRLAVPKKYQHGAIICMEGEVGHTAYLLLQGKAEVLLGSFRNEPKSVALLSPGVVFGEMSLLEDKPRSASVVVSSREATVLELTKSNFITILECDSEIAFHMLQTLLGRMNHLLKELQFKNNAFVRGIRVDSRYVRISSLTQEQFAEIIAKDSSYALTLLKYLSHLLAEIDEKAID